MRGFSLRMSYVNGKHVSSSAHNYSIASSIANGHICMYACIHSVCIICIEMRGFNLQHACTCMHYVCLHVCCTCTCMLCTCALCIHTSMHTYTYTHQVPKCLLFLWHLRHNFSCTHTHTLLHFPWMRCVSAKNQLLLY